LNKLARHLFRSNTPPKLVVPNFATAYENCHFSVTNSTSVRSTSNANINGSIINVGRKNECIKLLEERNVDSQRISIVVNRLNEKEMGSLIMNTDAISRDIYVNILIGIFSHNSYSEFKGIFSNLFCFVFFAFC
jgi:hypothetical protein